MPEFKNSPDNSYILRLAGFFLKGENPKSKTLLFILALPALAAIGMSLAVLWPTFSKERQFDKQMEFVEKLEPEQWHSLFKDPKPDLSSWENCSTDLSCPGNPQTKTLFAEAPLRPKNHVETVANLRGQRYWIGRVFPKEKLIEWRTKGATQILAGYFYATNEVFVDGVRTVFTDGSTSRLPLLIDLPVDPKKDLFVAIRILHDMDEPFPDSLFVSGVITPLGLEKHLRNEEFGGLIKPALGIGFSLGLGMFFFMLWIAARHRQEFAAFAAATILQASSQALMIPFVWLHLGNYYFHRISFILSWYHPLTIIFIGLAISRIRTLYSSIFIVCALVLPWFSLLTSWNTDQFYNYSYIVYNYIEVGSYFIAITLILLQARLVATKRGELWDPHREYKLYFFAALLFTFVLLQIILKVAPWDMRLYLSHFIISILAISATQEYHRQANFVSRSPISKYHQLAKEIVSLPSYVISVDLKNSEALFRLGAEQGIGGTLVKKLMFQLSGIVIQRESELISSEGDSLIFFMPQGDKPSVALQKCIEICKELKKSLDSYLKITNLPPNFELRIALQSGNIRPIWHDLGGRKLPGWEQVGISTVFVDLARILEAEAKAMPRTETTLSAVPAMAAEIKNLQSASDLKFEKHYSLIKHGRQLEIEIAVVI